MPSGAPVTEHLGLGFATKQMWRALQRHRGLFSFWFLGVLAAGCITLSLLKPTYTATAVVTIVPQTTGPLAPSGQQTADQFKDGDLPNTIAAMMQARDVAAAVLAQNPMPARPASRLKKIFCAATFSLICRQAEPVDQVLAQQAAIDQFLHTLRIAPVAESHIIDVSVTAANATRAALLARAVVSNYQHLALQKQIEQANGTAAWLASRTADLKQRWLAAMKMANAYAVQHNLTETSDGSSTGSLTNKLMDDVAANLARARSQLAEAEARADTLRDATAPYDETESRAHADQSVAIAQAQVKELTNQLDGLRAQDVAESADRATYDSLHSDAASAHADYAAFLQRSDEVADRATLLQPPVMLVSNAIIPAKPSFPNIPKLGFAVVLLALVAGAGAVLVRDHFSEDVEAADDLRALVDVPLLCSIPLLTGRVGRAVINHVLDEPLSRVSEAMRGLAASLSLLAVSRDSPRCVLITSAGAFEGKSTIAVWLATIVRKSGDGVLLIDGDHRRGKLLQGRDLPHVGLTDLLAGDVPLEAVIQHDPETKVDFIASGLHLARPFGSEEIAKLHELIAKLKKSYNTIVIDSPPLMAMADGFVLGSVADQTVFVCRWHHTSRGAVRASLERLQTYGANVAGIVVSMVDRHAAMTFDGQYSRREYELMSRLYGS